MADEIVRGCAHCGAEVPRKKMKFCGQTCRVAALRPKPCKCLNCGVRFSAIKWIGKRMTAYNGAKTCSPKCRNEWMRRDPERKRKIGLALRGDKHPNWQGGKSLFNNISGRGPGWQRQRGKALARDGRCVDCGITRDECRDKYGRDLDVDHVVPFHNFTDYRKANRLGNLACRCISCHRIEETKRRMVQMVLPMQARGRQHRGYACGERINTARLTALDVMEIRVRVKAGESRSGIAREKGVALSTVCMAASGATWRHLPMP